MAATTLRVPVELRDRIGTQAAARGLSAAGFVSLLLDEFDRAERFAAFGAAFAGSSTDYHSETSSWDATNRDGQDSWI